MADQYGLAEQVVDETQPAGKPPGMRGAHVKGSLFAGTWTPAPEAAQLSRAEHLAGGPLPATVRLSNGTSVPGVPDYARDGRGVGIKIALPSGGTTDMVGLNQPCFAVATPEQFLEFVRARRPDPETGKPDMAVLGAFLGAHPTAMTAVQHTLGQPLPRSFALETYRSIHSFWYTAADGTRRAGRWEMRPLDPGDEDPEISGEDARAIGPDYLHQDIVERVGQPGGVSWQLSVRLAAADDAVDDPSIPWQGEREEIPLGRLNITALETTRERDGDILVFDPTRLPDGVEPSADEILNFRPFVYAVSVERRSGHPRPDF